VPVEKVPDIERICRVPIQGWINQGFITATPGNMIDMRAVTDRIKWAAEMFDVIEVAYDPAGNMRVVAADLYDNDGITCVEVPQNFMTLSQPTKQLLGLISGQKAKARQSASVQLARWLSAAPVRPKRQLSALKARTPKKLKKNRWGSSLRGHLESRPYRRTKHGPLHRPAEYRLSAPSPRPKQQTSIFRGARECTQGIPARPS
jgi:hypothetical protein